MAASQSKYKPEYAEQAEKLCKFLGATNVELSDFFEVNESTIKDWAKAHAAFGKALVVGKMSVDADVVAKLYHRAMGYKHIAYKMFKDKDSDRVITKRYVEHYPPDTTACIFWLKNRRPDLWRDRHELTGKDGKDLPANQNTDVLEVARGVVWLMAEAERELAAKPPAPEVQH